MILGGLDIIQHYTDNKIHIDPYDIKHVGPNSYDVRLSSELLRVWPNRWEYNVAFIDPKLPQNTTRHTIPDSGLVIQPGELWLGCTIESIGSDHFVPMYDGRSTIGRMGLFSHVTAGFGDVGFAQQWTLELVATLPIVLYAGMRIGQISFHGVSDTTMSYKHGHSYAGQSGPTEGKAGNI